MHEYTDTYLYTKMYDLYFYAYIHIYVYDYT